MRRRTGNPSQIACARMRYRTAMKILYLLYLDPDQNNYRFYRLALPPGSKAVHKLWGRVGEYVTEKWEELPTRKEAEAHFEQVAKEKRREGYRDADQHVLPKNFFLYTPPPAAATERPADGQLSFLDFDAEETA